MPKISGHCQFVVSAVANDLRSFGQDSCDCHAGLSGAAINACDSGRCIVEGIRWWLIGCHRHPRLQIGQWHLRPQHADGLPDGRSEAPVRVRAPEADDHHDPPSPSSCSLASSRILACLLRRRRRSHMEKMARMIMIETEPTDTPITIPVFDGSVEGCKRPRQRCCPASVDAGAGVRVTSSGRSR